MKINLIFTITVFLANGIYAQNDKYENILHPSINVSEYGMSIEMKYMRIRNSLYFGSGINYDTGINPFVPRDISEPTGNYRITALIPIGYTLDFKYLFIDFETRAAASFISTDHGNKIFFGNHYFIFPGIKYKDFGVAIKAGFELNTSYPSTPVFGVTFRIWL